MISLAEVGVAKLTGQTKWVTVEVVELSGSWNSSNFNKCQRSWLFESQTTLHSNPSALAEYVKDLVKVDRLDESELVKTLQRDDVDADLANLINIAAKDKITMGRIGRRLTAFHTIVPCGMAL
ncbi:low molecular weight protein-tyrosine-phosphatasePtpB [Striga asiatica]|uniref:Low molecular weight protein-tyrosine-phosphatasePtpB n=1 Tax=Striga asiatica TaxID=4170 RepID=A0A5A7PJR3_STRAF|nr:low molecular weight protein-tyrosine-phosphatasePtpB [Striga asiatica]